MKNYMVFTMLSTISILCLIVYVSASHHDIEQRIAENNCENPSCLKAAEAIIKNMNTSHKPCDNFYLFACGKFVKEANIPKGQGYTDSVSKMRFELQKKLKASLEQKVSKDELRPFKLLRSYYKVCLETDHIGDVYRKQIVDILSEFARGPRSRNEYWMNCIDYVTMNMPLASAAFYVREYFNKTLKTNISDITKYIRKAFKNTISEASWMDNASKNVAQRKLELMNPREAYPDEFLDDKKLNYYYENLPNPTKNFLKDHLTLMQFNYEKKLKHSIKYSNKNNDWASHVVMYHNADNSIDISAGFLQEQFLASDRPNYLNYGGIGHEIAHAMSHGFDGDGSRFNENGNEKKWWDSETTSEYKNRTRCFVEQYNKYKASKRKIPLNGEYTLKENIADSSGFKIAYRAYDEWEKENGQESSLPGLPYTPRQLFWISAANTMCTRFRSKGWDFFLKDKHSPAPFRIIGSFSNIHEFASDFGCPIGSRMNPKKKCSLW